MNHDFDPANGGDSGYCNSLNGIMSYGQERVNEWSNCSVNSLTASYNSQKWGERCLKGEKHETILWIWFVLRKSSLI